MGDEFLPQFQFDYKQTVLAFNKDTKVDYNDKNAVLINCVFGKFDTDKSGDFYKTDENGNKVLNVEEWNAYQNYVKNTFSDEKMSNKENDLKLIKHYGKQLKKSLNKLEKNHKKWMKEDSNLCFKKLLDFEQAHSGLKIVTCAPDKIPEGKEIINIAFLGRGIFNEETGNFTGETAEFGYIEGLETLSEEDKKTFSELLKNAKDQLEKQSKIEEKSAGIKKEIEKNMAFLDMAYTGELDKFLSSNEEEQKYMSYKAIYDGTNPFHQKIRELETNYQTIWLKGNKTEDDYKQLEQIQLQLWQLKSASQNWSISYAERGSNNNSSMNNSSVNLSSSYDESSITNDQMLNFGVMDSNSNINVSANITEVRKFQGKENGEFSQSEQDQKAENTEFTFRPTLSGGYQKGVYGISGTSTLYKTPDMLNISQEITGSYKNYSLGITESLMLPQNNNSADNQEEKREISELLSTNINLGYNRGNTSSNVYMNISDFEKNYGLNARTSFDILSSENTTLSVNPMLNASYNELAKTVTLAPNLGVNFMYRYEDFSLNLNMNESYTNTINLGKEPEVTNNFSMNLNTQYELYKGNIGTSLKYNNLSSSSFKSQNYGAEISYGTPIGDFYFEYSREISEMPSQEATAPPSSSHRNRYAVSYKLPIDKIKNWGKKDIPMD